MSTSVLTLALKLKFGFFASFDMINFTPAAIFCAVYSQSIEMVKLALSLKDVDVNCTDMHSCLPIYYSIIKTISR